MWMNVRTTIKKYGMLRRGQHVLVGVSGGADSVALIAVLHRLSTTYGLTLTAAHFNHRMRSAESDRDEAFVRTLCRSLGIGLICGSLRDGGRTRGLSQEDFLRRKRYGFFDRARKKSGADCVALGHHQGDQAETVLMNIVRGAGLSGLSGIPPVRGDGFIRPLIECTRKEILDYLAAEGISFVDDSTNTDERFLRNRIRSRLLPELKKSYNPNIEGTLCRLADVARWENDYMARQAQVPFDRWSRGDAPGLPIAELRGLHPALQCRVILEMIRSCADTDAAVGFEHVQDVLSLAGGGKPGGSLNLPGGVLVQRIYGRLEFRRAGRTSGRQRGVKSRKASGESFVCAVTVPGTLRIESLGCSLRFRELKRAPSTQATNRRVYMDMDRIALPIVVRSTRPGDRIQPLGMEGTRKLKSVFIDEKIPREQRAKIPVVADALSVLWVPGVRLSERVRIREHTRRVLSAEII